MIDGKDYNDFFCSLFGCFHNITDGEPIITYENQQRKWKITSIFLLRCPKTCQRKWFKKHWNSEFDNEYAEKNEIKWFYFVLQ